MLQMEIRPVPGSATPNSGTKYIGIWEGNEIALGKDPEHAACRYLRDRGYSGRLEFLRDGKVSSYVRELTRTAEFAVSHAVAGGIKRFQHKEWYANR